MCPLWRESGAGGQVHSIRSSELLELRRVLLGKGLVRTLGFIVQPLVNVTTLLLCGPCSIALADQRGHIAQTREALALLPWRTACVSAAAAAAAAAGRYCKFTSQEVSLDVAILVSRPSAAGRDASLSA